MIPDGALDLYKNQNISYSDKYRLYCQIDLDRFQYNFHFVEKNVACYKDK